QKGRGHSGNLFHIVDLHPIVDVHRRVMRARVVLVALLRELKSRNTDGIERHVVGRLHRSRTDEIDTKIRKRASPRLEDVPGALVTLGPDAPNATGAVIEVEVRR